MTTNVWLPNTPPPVPEFEKRKQARRTRYAIGFSLVAVMLVAGIAMEAKPQASSIAKVEKPHRTWKATVVGDEYAVLTTDEGEDLLIPGGSKVLVTERKSVISPTCRAVVYDTDGQRYEGMMETGRLSMSLLPNG